MSGSPYSLSATLCIKINQKWLLTLFYDIVVDVAEGLVEEAECFSVVREVRVELGSRRA